MGEVILKSSEEIGKRKSTIHGKSKRCDEIEKRKNKIIRGTACNLDSVEISTYTSMVMASSLRKKQSWVTSCDWAAVLDPPRRGGASDGNNVALLADCHCHRVRRAVTMRTGGKVRVCSKRWLISGAPEKGTAQTC